MKTKISPPLGLLLSGLLLMASCIKSPSREKTPDPGPAPETVTYDDLALKSLAIAPDANERIFGTVVFAPEASAGRWNGRISGYKADRTQLVAEFDAVAARVTVDDAEQQSGKTANDFSKPVVYRLYADDGQYKEFTAVLDNDGYTGCPVVGIVTDGQKGVTSRDVWIPGRMVIDRQEGECDELAAAIEIKGRGHNSWSRDKKPYAIKLAEKSPVMGMNKQKRWVLLANAGDRTLLRNRVAYEIGRRTQLAWTPDSRFVEVVLNGKYLGSYQLCEQIRVDKNRVDITEMTAQDIAGEALTGGYLLEVDRYYDEPNKFRTKYRDLPVNIKEPDEKVLTAGQKTYIADYINKVEELLCAGEQPDPAYRDYIDIDSFADWWIVIELCHNRDTRLPGSCYMYKERGEKLCAGPLWDFDLMTFIPSTSFLLKEYEITDFSKEGGDRSLWYKRLFADPIFAARVKERWQAYKPAFETIPAFIDAEAEKLEVSARANWDMWTLTGNFNRDETLAWHDAVELLKKNYSDRLAWMDGQVAKL